VIEHFAIDTNQWVDRRRQAVRERHLDEDQRLAWKRRVEKREAATIGR
jgi:hypothetical protein